MNDFVVRLVVNAIAVFAVIQAVPRIGFERRIGIENIADEWPKLLGVALILGLVNSYLRPIVRILSLPLNLVALGFVGLAVNVAMLLVVALLSDAARLGFTIAGWPRGPFTLEVLVYALAASLIISIVSTTLALVRLITPRI